MPIPLAPADRRRLTTLLANLAAVYPAGVSAFYRDVVRRADIPSQFKLRRGDGWTGDAAHDAQTLVDFGVGMGTVPSTGCSTLGAFLRVLLDEHGVGLEDASTLVALIEVYKLSPGRPPAASPGQTGQKYLAGARATADADDEGPDFRWRGPTDAIELQSWRRPEPPLLDVGFLARALFNAASVCRIELPSLARSGTGVRVAPALVLTNHHVLQWDASEQLARNAQDVIVQFSVFTDSNGAAAAGHTFRLAASEPVCRWSAPLDYVLLRLDDSVLDAQDIGVCWLASKQLSTGSGINLLQHPWGGPMKLAIASNGVTSVLEDEGLVQYVTAAAGGSSGAPCFDEEWRVAALHHAQRARPFGRIGEGILINAIHREIADLLP